MVAYGFESGQCVKDALPRIAVDSLLLQTATLAVALSVVGGGGYADSGRLGHETRRRRVDGRGRDARLPDLRQRRTYVDVNLLCEA